MLFRIRAKPLGALRILGELPDAKLATLEGLNGIGKTLAVRILQICTGHMPYSVESTAWRSLCAGVGPFQVFASGLMDDSTIRWEADSRDWLEPTLDATTRAATFRSITVNGEPASLDEVRKRISVIRIAGDEGLVETISAEADAVAGEVRRWAQRITAPNGPLTALLGEVGSASDALGSVTQDGYNKAIEQARANEADLRRSNELTTEAAERLASLDRAIQIARRITDAENRTPGLQARLRELDEELAEARTRQQQLNRDLTAVAGKAAKAGPANAELVNARRTLRNNREKLQAAANLASVIATSIGLPQEQGVVDARLAELSATIEALIEEQTSLDAVPAMRQLLGDVSEDLGAAETRGLGEQVAIDDVSTGLQLTVTQSREGMRARRTALEGMPPAPQARAVSERLTAARRELQRVEELVQVLRDVGRFRRLVTTNQGRVQSALAVADPDVSTRLRELESAREQVDEEILSLAAERAAVRHQLGDDEPGVGIDALRAQLNQTLEELNASIETVSDLRDAAEELLSGHQSRLGQARSMLAEGRREVARLEAEIRRCAHELHSPPLQWLASALPDAVPQEGSATQQLSGLHQAQMLLDRLDGRLNTYRVQLAAVERALGGIARHLRGQDVGAVEYVPELQTWLAARFADWFNHPRVKHELFERATGQVTVDLGQATVHWTEGDVERYRPFEAFSSGEQAYAYTRARLAMLDESPVVPAERLIVLDEFGAFIAYDRLAALLVYLRERAAEVPADQTLVVLPLSRDYEQLARSSLGDEADHFGALQAEIESRSYAVEVHVP